MVAVAVTARAATAVEARVVVARAAEVKVEME